MVDAHSKADGKGEDVREALTDALARILTPLVRIAIRHGLPYRAFAALCKRIYIDVARAEFRIPGRKQSASRVSLLTGMPRKEVSRMLHGNDDLALPAAESASGAARVLAGWRRDSRFADARGRPATLTLEGSGPSFAALVRRYGNDVPSRAVLDELVRVGAARVQRNGRVRLLSRAYIPAKTKADTIGILGSDVSDLAHTIEHNLECPSEQAFLERKVAYDNIPRESLERLRKASTELAQTTLEKADRMVAKRDRDATPSVRGKGRHRVVLGMYYLEQDLSGEESS